MKIFQNLRMRTKLICFSLVISLIPISIITFESEKISSRFLIQKSFEHLISVRDIKKAQIERLFYRFREEIDLLADTIHFFVDGSYEPMKEAGLIHESKEEFLSNIKTPKGENFFVNYIKTKGYKDLYLISPNGYCFFSARKGPVFKTNLLTGKYASTNLGRLIKRVIETKKFGFADFAPYAPDNNKPAAFIALPHGDKEGIKIIIALRLSLKRINRIMQERQGMGDTGETYLVGPDKRMRSDSYLDKEGHSVAASFAGTVKENGVDTEAVRLALEGKEGHKILRSYTGDLVLCAYAPVNVYGTTWALVSQINKSEVYAPIRSLIKKIVIISSVAALIIIVLAWIISTFIAGPIQRATNFAKAISRGEMDAELKVHQRDEIGQMCRAILSIRDTLMDIVSRIKNTSRQVRYGKLMERIPTEGFSGEFESLVEDINELLNVLTGHMDSMPMPIMAVDKEFNVLFMNRTGRSIVGNDCVGKKCYEVMNSSDCNTERCAGRRALSRGTESVSETDAHPNGRDMEIEYHAIPLKDREKGTVGFYEIIIDQTKIKTILKNMQTVAGEANEISERLSSAAHEISAQVEQVSEGSEEEKMRIGEVATAMEEMNATVLEVAKNAAQAADSAARTREEAENGSSVVERAIEAIDKVNALSERLKENMHSLGKRAEAIGEVMNVISDIADQTNLLALNAAIEAARAGEAGRGFAVVADEVRKLAEKTMGATKEVGDAIHSIQASARENIRSMEEASKVIEEATNLAGESGDALKRIVEFAVDNANQIQSIATAAEEQSATSEEIMRSIEDVNRIVAETSDAMSQSSQAVQELANMASELADLIKKLEDA